jgi:hypothetical protein
MPAACTYKSRRVVASCGTCAMNSAGKRSYFPSAATRMCAVQTRVTAATRPSSCCERGQDPALARLKDRADGAASLANTFEVIARDWHARSKPTWTDRHAEDVLGSLARDVFPSVGALPITECTPPLVLNLLRANEARPAIETARRVRQRMSAVFVYAIASGLAEADPAAIVQNAMAPLIRPQARRGRA